MATMNDSQVAEMLHNEELNPQNDTSTASTNTTSPIVAGLLTRAKVILSELEDFRHHIRLLRQEGSIELSHYRSTVQSELDMLSKLSLKPESESTNHIARSSNLPFLETVWSTAKKSTGLTALLKRVYLDPEKTQILSEGMQYLKGSNGNLGQRRAKRGAVKRKAVMVDVITDSGRMWAKISLVTNTRLLFDLAKEGWDSGGSDEDDDEGFASGDDGSRDGGKDEEDADIPLVKTTRELTTAVKSFRVRTREPKVVLILPRVKLGETPEVDKIIDRCKALGATVICGNEDERVTPPLEDAVDAMAPDPIKSFSDVLNIDCTILLALVSEFSHAKVSKEPWFHTALQRQVEIEDNENLLPLLLYPALGKHRLVCTTEAAKRMLEIVETIGTPSEKARTAIFMNTDPSKTRDQLLLELQHWSAYPVPSDLQLPITVVDQDENNCQSSLPDVAASATTTMTAINKSVFLHGWASGRTTITSNRTVVKAMETSLESNTNLDDAVWPKIWLCPTARSLVGKEKRGAAKREEINGSRKDGTAWRMPDPLRREQQRRHGLDVLGEREGGEVEDFRPNGYPCEEVIQAKMESSR